ncbi:hypothetical protein B8V81_0971 [Paenibacillus pasadenensis]|uniref:Uncharacterized protein n=1 Tax=Paenibacillus pasadenensis TaxID=217090 RepID=A0A2N5N8R8_9BACL|nr:hypothetical protein B8V81_0971 [Paenibacillus pasadenensis]
MKRKKRRGRPGTETFGWKKAAAEAAFLLLEWRRPERAV